MPALRKYKIHGALFLALGLAISGWFTYQGLAEAREWQSAVRVPVADLVPGTVQLVQGVWVTHQPNGEFIAFQNRSSFYPDRSLRWLEAEGQFEEPISSARYGLDGVGRFGPAGQLYRVKSRVEGDLLLVLPTRIVSGGPGDPAWLVDLKHLLLGR